MTANFGSQQFYFQKDNAMISIVTPSVILELVANGIKVSGAKRFAADKASLKEANIGVTGNNFDQHFFGKVEENVEDAILAVHRLKERSTDAQIRKELGKKREEIALTHFFDLLKNQSKGQEGYLLVNGHATIAHICNKNEDPWTVNAFWNSVSRYWHVGAFSVEDPGDWITGYQVVSRDC